MVTAELLARPYYAALRDATASPLLSKICLRFLDEEGAHLRFQAFALSRFRHSQPIRTLIKTSHFAFFACTAALVWMEHYSVFRAAGRTFSKFWQEALQEFDSLYRM